jgi:SAM-dependent methyltransferase
MDLWQQHPTRFYAHPYQIVRQEWFHMTFPTFRPTAPFLALVQSTARVLDYGCGTAEWLRGGWIDAGRSIDLVEQAGCLLPYLAAKYPALVGRRLTVQDWQATSSTYDAIVCLDVLEHVAQPRRLLSHLWDVLKPGGIAALWFDPSFPHPGHLAESIAQRPAYYAWLRAHGTILHDDTITLVRKPRRLWGSLPRKLHRMSHQPSPESLVF